MISQYNTYMRDVDLADNMLSNYRIRIRGKKWWWPIFFNHIDTCLINAGKLWLGVHHYQKTSLLRFRRQLKLKLLNTKPFATYATGRPSVFALENCRLSHSTSHHFLKTIACNKRGRFSHYNYCTCLCLIQYSDLTLYDSTVRELYPSTSTGNILATGFTTSVCFPNDSRSNSG